MKQIPGFQFLQDVTLMYRPHTIVPAYDSPMLTTYLTHKYETLHFKHIPGPRH